MSGLSAEVTTVVRSATASAKTASAVVPVGCPREDGGWWLLVGRLGVVGGSSTVSGMKYDVEKGGGG